MNLSKLDFYCLSWISDDYENIQHIKDVLERHDSINALEEDLLASLGKLVGEKLAQAYEYDQAKQEYIKVEPSRDKSSVQWFYITKAGADCLYENRRIHPEWSEG